MTGGTGVAAPSDASEITTALSTNTLSRRPPAIRARSASEARERSAPAKRRARERRRNSPPRRPLPTNEIASVQPHPQCDLVERMFVHGRPVTGAGERAAECCSSDDIVEHGKHGSDDPRVPGPATGSALDRDSSILLNAQSNKEGPETHRSAQSTASEARERSAPAKRRARASRGFRGRSPRINSGPDGRELEPHHQLAAPSRCLARRSLIRSRSAV